MKTLTKCRSPIKDVEIKVLLKGALTDEINSREVYKTVLTKVITMRDLQPLRLKNYKNISNTLTDSGV